VTSDVNDCWVKAVVGLSGTDEKVEIKREINKPKKLICDEEYIDFLEPIQELASRGGQHVLPCVRFLTSLLLMPIEWENKYKICLRLMKLMLPDRDWLKFVCYR